MIVSQTTLDWTFDDVKERKAFGKPIGSFHNSRFVPPSWRPRLTSRNTRRRLLRALNQGERTAVDASTAKWWCTELQGRAVDKCSAATSAWRRRTHHGAECVVHTLIVKPLPEV
jgi:hypothetical protein